jgi:iron complex transport system permease protein
VRPHAPRALAALAALLGAAVILAIGRGAVPLSPAEVIAALGDRLGLSLGDVTEQQAAIVWSIRLPRVLLAVLVGAALGAAGAALQGVVRNALADPALIGVSGGAALGAVGVIVLGGPLLAQPAIGFVGLAVPYLVRGVLGPGHRALLPACALGGALLLVLADLIARTIVAPTELPIGVLTALAGAPVLLALVRRGHGGAVMP